MRITEFIDNYAELIDSGNTYDLLFYANMNLSDEDLSILTKELAKLGLNMLEHLKKDNDEVRLFDDDFTIENLQEYLDKNFGLRYFSEDYFKYNLCDIFALLEKHKSDLGISFGSGNMDSFEYTDEYLEYVEIKVVADPDQHFIQVLFVTENGLVYEIQFDIEHDAFSLNSSVGYTLNRVTLNDEIAGIDVSLRNLINANLKED